MVCALLVWMMGCGVIPSQPLADPAGAGAQAATPAPGGHPGAAPLPASVQAAIDAAWAARPADYVPRTRHLEPDGSPTYTNRLFLETSPYLLQHAHNPVNWFPWGDEAFAEAKARGVPVFMSIGYSTCHWCHVMEEESFEDLETATYLNANYVAIKVDREERPDIDAIYMSAVTLLTGGGGWPMSVWLNHERQPWFGGTYFPAASSMGRPGFKDVLEKLHEVWLTDGDNVAASASEITAAVQSRLSAALPPGALPGAAAIDAAVAEYSGEFDDTWGGLGGAPKFPSSLPIRLLLRTHRRTGAARPLEMASLSLEKMAAGGMYDQVGGGFHRYSTDRQWLTPHFEKMLYDNAQLATAYLEAWQLTGRADFARVTRETLDYVLRDMTSPEGGFYSATDADSLGPDGDRAEGWFYTWTSAELREVLGEETARQVGAWYGVSDGGNFEGRTILSTPRELGVVAAELGVEPSALEATIQGARETLYQARRSRPAPIRDEKVLAGWNGLMISAFARAGLALDEPRYTQAAARAADFALHRLMIDGRLFRSTMGGKTQHMGVLDDHAFLAAGLLDLFEATGDPRWLAEARSLDALVRAHFEDPAGGWFRTADDAEALLAREKPWQDRATPSGASVHTLTLLRLSELTGEADYRARADAALTAQAGVLERSPTALAELLLAVDWIIDKPKEIVLITPGDAASARADAAPFLERLGASFLPNAVLIVSAEADVDALSAVVPLVDSKVARDDRVTAYVCEQGACQLPTTDPLVFSAQIGAR